MCAISYARESRSIVQVYAEVLKEKMSLVKERLGDKVNNIKAIVTVLAYFNAQQKEAIKEAARIAGINLERTISEPTAAAIAALDGLQLQDDDKVVVFDLGGGTLDISVLGVFSINESVPKVELTRGDMSLGGRDFDECLIDLVIKKFSHKLTST